MPDLHGSLYEPSSFRFFDLPTEMRRQILAETLVFDRTIDIEFKEYANLQNMLLVSKRFREEAADVFYGGNLFRMLPTHSRAVGKYARPLLRDLSQFHRSRIVSLELRLGPFWDQPPACWKINARLGLEEAVRVRRLRVFVEIDPTLPWFKGFRSTKISYVDFCLKIFGGCLKRLPCVSEVQFDAYPSSGRGNQLMDRLVDLAIQAGKRITWGPYQRAVDRDRS